MERQPTFYSVFITKPDEKSKPKYIQPYLGLLKQKIKEGNTFSFTHMKNVEMVQKQDSLSTKTYITSYTPFQ